MRASKPEKTRVAGGAECVQGGIEDVEEDDSAVHRDGQRPEHGTQLLDRQFAASGEVIDLRPVIKSIMVYVRRKCRRTRARAHAHTHTRRKRRSNAIKLMNNSNAKTPENDTPSNQRNVPEEEHDEVVSEEEPGRQ